MTITANTALPPPRSSKNNPATAAAAPVACTAPATGISAPSRTMTDQSIAS